MTRPPQSNCWNPRVPQWTNLKKNGVSSPSLPTFQLLNPPLLKYLSANNLLEFGPVCIPAWIGFEDLRIQEN
jgi:hypothetical protein